MRGRGNGRGRRGRSGGVGRGLVAALVASVYVELFPVVWWILPLAGLAWLVVRVLRRPVRVVVWHPVSTVVVAGLVAWYLRTGWAGLAWPAAVLAGLGAGWRYRWPSSFERQVTTRARSWWRWRWVYRRRWREVMLGCGLVVTTPYGSRVPVVAAIRSRRDQDRLTLLLPPGQVPDHVIEAGTALAHALRAHRVSGRDLGAGRVAVTVFRTDPIAHPIVPTMLPGGADPDGRGLLRDDITAEEVTWRLSNLVAGRTEDGDPWVISIRPGSHLLVHGTTGAGKSGLLWVILWSLADLIVSGWVEVYGFDPKVVELRPVAASGLGVVCTDVAEMPGRLTAQVRDMDARFTQMDGREHIPSPDSPVRLVIVDELAVLTALANSTKVKNEVEAALGALQSKGRAAGFEVILSSVDATKETVRWRPLCDTRICYRTSEAIADMVFGEGAHDRGIRSEDIPATLPGVAYARGRDGQISRVRTLHITDRHIDALTTAVRAVRLEQAATPSGSCQ
jgi:DNA segregation ATPase FtsK/SpoIIIE, S-DNA-T family